MQGCVRVFCEKCWTHHSEGGPCYKNKCILDELEKDTQEIEKRLEEEYKKEKKKRKYIRD